MSRTMWDERYAAEEYVYGTSPNQFFREELAKLAPGRLLLPAEGEVEIRFMPHRGDGKSLPLIPVPKGKKRHCVLPGKKGFTFNIKLPDTARFSFLKSISIVLR
nr:hypothetical protein [Prolixibacter bellariivorans]